MTDNCNGWFADKTCNQCKDTTPHTCLTRKDENGKTVYTAECNQCGRCNESETSPGRMWT